MIDAPDLFEPPSAPAYLPGPLVGPRDPPLFTRLDPGGGMPVLLVGDHAGREIPDALDRLGLDDADLDRHIAYDIGIDRLTRRLSARLDAPALIHHYSRLLIDPNRPVDDPTSICVVSDGTVIPGNRGLSEEDRRQRAETFFHPYHRAVAEAVGAHLDRGIAPALISLHSFTPRFRGQDRPWQVGVLWDEDGRIAVPLMARLAEDQRLCVGDNRPYAGRRGYGYTVDTHAMQRGLANVLIEVRQDLIATQDGADRWADRLADVLVDILADERLYRRAEPPC